MCEYFFLVFAMLSINFLLRQAQEVTLRQALYFAAQSYYTNDNESDTLFLKIFLIHLSVHKHEIMIDTQVIHNAK